MFNWAGNIEYRASGIEYPGTFEELAALVERSRSVKVLGSRHSFNRIADTTALHLSLEKIPPSMKIDREQATVTVSAGVPYGTVCEFLHQHGFALHNLASLPHISVAGACATATHGSGPRHRNLAAAVTGLQMITAAGNPVSLSQGDAGFNHAVVGLGALGIVTRITLALQPTYQMRQWVYESLPMADLDDYFERLMRCAYSVSLFTDWRDDAFTQVWIKERIGDEEADAVKLARAKADLESRGAQPADRPLHPVDGDPNCCTTQLGEPGPWHERLPHFRMSFTPSAGKELQSEYFISRSDAPQVIQAIYKLRRHISPLLLVTEVRTIAADDFTMSPCYQRDSVAIHFTWKPHSNTNQAVLSNGLSPEVEEVLHQIEKALAPFEARPHLGKLFAMNSARLQSVYQNMTLFRKEMERLDPHGKFCNEFLSEYIMGAQ